MVSRFNRWTALLVVAGLVLVGLGTWCILLMGEVTGLRSSVTHRVDWLETIHLAQTQLEEEPVEVGALQVRALELTELSARMSDLDSEAAFETRQAADGYLALARAEGEVGEPARQELARALSALVPAIRAETGQLSQQLWDTWNRLTLLMISAFVLGATIIGAVIYARFAAAQKASLSMDRLHKQLLHADRLAAVGTLAAGVAHEVNNPMTYVISNLRLLRRALAKAQSPADIPAGELEELIDDALGGAERVTAIVRDLHSFANPADDQLGPVDVRVSLDAALKIASPQLRKRAQVIREYDDVPPVRANDTRLGQVFLNLVINAAHAMEEGDARVNELRITTRFVSGNVEIIVSDTGAGMPQDMVERVFEPFVTTKPLGKGTGLGLFVCHGVVMSLGGTIELESSSSGTTVRVRLPPMDETGPRDVTGEGASRLKILIVDDQPLIASALARALSHHDVTLCQTARMAIEALEEHDFDVVLCDLMMSDLTGAELHSKAVELRKGVSERFLFLTGDTLNDAARGILETMPDRLLHKPFNADELREAVQTVARASTRF